MQIVDKFGLVASNSNNNSKPTSKSKINKAYSYTVSSHVDDVKEGSTDDCYVHFVDACLAMSRYVICKAENISFEKLRKELVDNYTRRMWLKEYPDQEVNRFFIGRGSYKGSESMNNKNKAKCETESLSKFLERRLLTKEQKVFKERLKRTRESVQGRTRNNACECLISADKEEEQHFNVNERKMRFSDNNSGDTVIQMRCYTDNCEHNAMKMYDNLTNNLLKGRSDNSSNSNSNSNSMFSVVFYNPSELLEATERRHHSLGNMQSI